MTAGHYVAVEVRDGIGEPLLFTSEVPAPLAPYAMALIELANNSQRLITLEHEVGRLTTLLGERDEQIQELQSQLAYYEAASSEPAVARESLNDESVVPAPELPEDPADQLTPEQVPDIAPEIDLTPDLSLSEKDQQLERAILYGLGVPGLAVRCLDAGGFMRRELGIEDNQEWQWLRKKMGDLGIYSFEKESPQARRTRGICVHVEAVLAASGASFFTPRVQEAVSKVRVEEASAGADAVQPVSPPTNGNGAGPGHVISARVRRAMALDSARPLSPADVYRTDGKKPPEIKPFFEHQPVSTGAKRH